MAGRMLFGCPGESGGTVDVRRSPLRGREERDIRTSPPCVSSSIGRAPPCHGGGSGIVTRLTLLCDVEGLRQAPGGTRCGPRDVGSETFASLIRWRSELARRGSFSGLGKGNVEGGSGSTGSPDATSASFPRRGMVGIGTTNPDCGGSTPPEGTVRLGRNPCRGRLQYPARCSEVQME